MVEAPRCEIMNKNVYVHKSVVEQLNHLLNFRLDYFYSTWLIHLFIFKLNSSLSPAG